MDSSLDCLPCSVTINKSLVLSPATAALDSRTHGAAVSFGWGRDVTRARMFTCDVT